MEETNLAQAAELEEIARLKKALVAAEAKMATMAQLDKITRLPNKALFEDRLTQAMARTRRSKKLMAVFYLDIHHTKLITAKLGVIGKNTLTREFAARFRAAIRETDTLGRVGFDRYAVIMEDVKSEKQVKAIVAKIIDNLDKGFVIDEHDITVMTSIGVTFYDGAPESTTIDVLTSVDKAVNKAKAEGKSTYEIGTTASI